MRQARLKPAERDTWHHCYNRLAGTSADRPLGDAEKEQFVRILRRVAALYTVRVVAYQVMSNHFHLLLQAPAEAPGEQETCRRYEAFHGGKRKLAAGTEACGLWQQRLRDLSWCLRHLEHLYSAWYNRSRPVRRRGPLWAGRFKNAVLESGPALWTCWSYIEANPLRAGLVTDPADYRFGSYGQWVQSGRHPFAGALRGHLIPALGLGTEDQVRELLRQRFARVAEEMRAPAPEAAEVEPGFTLSARRRVRHWVDGLVIGSALFVRETMRRVRPAAEVEGQELTVAEAEDNDRAPLCCWKRLRVMLD